MEKPTKEELDLIELENENVNALLVICENIENFTFSDLQGCIWAFVKSEIIKRQKEINEVKAEALKMEKENEFLLKQKGLADKVYSVFYGNACYTPKARADLLDVCRWIVNDFWQGDE